MKEKALKPRFKIAKWIMFSFAILFNAFIIVYSCIPEEVTADWNRTITNIFTSFINTITHKEVVVTPLEKIETKLSNEETYKYNYLPGYGLNEIPLGSAKQIECSFFPVDASNKAVTYSANPSDSVVLNQSGSIVSVVGIKAGECVITAKSSDGGFESSVTVEVVNTVAPTSFEISLDKTEIAIGTTQTIDFDIDGGNLGHNELVNFRYYDTRLLSFSSSNESVATVDEYGVIYPESVGKTKITVSNGSFCSKEIEVDIISGTAPTLYSNVSIEGSRVCYANDMILSQGSSKYQYQLTLKDGDIELDPEDFIWKSSNELLVKVDKHGIMRGFRKSSNEDETATITAISKRPAASRQMFSYDVTVQNQLPTAMYYWFKINDQTIWNSKAYTFSEGDNVLVGISYDPYNRNGNVSIVSSNEEVVSVTNEGSNIILHILKEGESTITITSIINPELTGELKCTVVKAGAISKDDLIDVGLYIRKSLGHAAVFMVAQIFTFLTFYMFFYDKKWWLYSSFSLGEGLIISSLSELIQFIVPSRDGNFKDVLINFGGIVVGALLTFLVISLIKIAKNRKENKKRVG